MAQPKIPLSFADLAWAWAGDVAKFQSRANTNNDVKELVLVESEIYNDDFSSDPLADFTEEDYFAGQDILWNAGGYLYSAQTDVYGRPDVIYLDGLGDQDALTAYARIHPGGFSATNIRGSAGIVICLNAATDDYYFLGIAGGAIESSEKVPYYGGMLRGNSQVLSNLGSTNRDILQQIFLTSAWYKIRLWVMPPVFKIKIWRDGDAEPTTGGPDNDGYLIRVRDTELTSGRVGLAMGSYGGANFPTYISELVINSAAYSAASPRYISRTDSGKAGSIWAGGTYDVGANLAPTDTATVTFYEAYSYPAWGSGDEASIQAALGSELSVTAGQVTLVGGTGRYRYIVAKIASDGTQQGSIILLGTGQDLIMKSGGFPLIDGTMIRGVA